MFNTVSEGVNVTTEEAGRLATGLVGAAAADRESGEWDVQAAKREATRPPEWWERTRLSAVHLHVEPDVKVTANVFADQYAVRLGPVTIHGAAETVEATLVAALEAVRAARQGPVGA